jgi:hypothetical protein
MLVRSASHGGVQGVDPWVEQGRERMEVSKGNSMPSFGRCLLGFFLPHRGIGTCGTWTRNLLMRCSVMDASGTMLPYSVPSRWILNRFTNYKPQQRFLILSLAPPDRELLTAYRVGQ